ncbi:hypothetical protein EI94DRAFT_1623686 [Lactarius quietus]|nr:hypothetical protein EI94DRAFT_1623686 [Lactarius quietus]
MSNVMATATANAGINRRVNNSEFLCPVLGCGSMFTCHVSLKGMAFTYSSRQMPGCGKGFVRQEDCKRHERLHSNHCRLACDGCRRPFARADGLNRLCASFFPLAFFLCGSDRMLLFSTLRTWLRLSVRRLESRITAGPFASVNLRFHVSIYPLRPPL